MTNLNIAKLYLATNTTATAAQIDAAIADDSAATAVNALTGTTLLNAIYQASFGRDADAEGLAYWGASTLTGDALVTAINAGAAVYVANDAYPENVAIAANDTVVTAAKTTAEAAASSASVGSVAAAVVTVVDTATSAAAIVTIDAADAAADAAATAATEYVLTEDTLTADYSASATKVSVTLDGDDDAVDGSAFDVKLSAYNDTVVLDSYKDAVIDGGTGVDTLNLLELSPGANNADVNLAAGTTGAISPAAGGITTIVNFENVIASDDGGRIVGTTGVNTITIGEGTDDISTSGGNDIIIATDDTFVSGTDTIDGGSGTDKFLLNGEKTVTFAAADFTSVETIIIDGVEDDDVTVAAANLFDVVTGSTSAVTSGVTSIEVIGGGDNTMTITADGVTDNISLLNVSITGINKGITFDATTAGGGDILVDTNSLTGVNKITGDAADILTLIGGGSLDLSGVSMNTLVEITGTSADDTFIFGNTIGDITTVSGVSGDDTITFANTLVGDISATYGNLATVDTLEFGSANYVTVASDDVDEFSTVTGTTSSDTLVLNDVNADGAADLSATTLTDVETIVVDSVGANHTLTVKSTTLTDVTLIQGDSGTDTLIIGGANVSLETVTLEAFEALDVNGNAMTASTAALDGLALDSGVAGGKITLADNDAATLTGSALAADLTIVGTSDADDLTLKSFDDTTDGLVLQTGEGDDTVTLGTGNTLAGGGAGTQATSIELGAGDDTMNIAAYHASIDAVDGGIGTDTLTFAGTVGSGDLLAADFTAFEKVAVASSSIDAISLTLGATDVSVATIDFSADTNVTGANVINLAAHVVASTVTGSAGADTITTTVKNDTIDAGAGDDTVIITGNAGTAATAYEVTLGAGNDTLQMGANTSVAVTTDETQTIVTVTDFNADADKIDLTLIDGLGGTAGIAAAGFVAQTIAQAAVDSATPSTLTEALTAAEATTAAAAGTAAEITYATVFQYDGDTYVGLYDDVSGIVAGDDNYIKLTGTHDLALADNFIVN